MWSYCLSYYKILPRRYSCHRGCSNFPPLLDAEMDPTFEEFLPRMLRAGSRDRPSPDLARDLRKKYSTPPQIDTNKTVSDEPLVGEKNVEVKTKKSIKRSSMEDDSTFEENLPKLLKAGLRDRPSPDLPSDLRKQFLTRESAANTDKAE